MGLQPLNLHHSFRNQPAKGGMRLSSDSRVEGNISVTGAAVHWFGQFLGAGEPAKRVAMPFRTADIILVGGIPGC
jgi:hypothetical protein